MQLLVCIEKVIKKIVVIFIIFLTFSAISMEENWIFLGNINFQDKETTSWRIKNGRLELNSNIEDPIKIDTFTHLLKKAQKKDIPYILIGLRDKNSFYHFLDGSYLPILASKWENPITRQPPYIVEIWVAGNDEKLIFIDAENLETIKNNFLILQDSKWQFKKNLKKSGYGHLLIANLFIRKATSIHQSHYKINQEELHIIYQHAFQWLDWALKHLPPGEEHLQAEQERDRIFKILKPTSHALINNAIVKEAWKIKKQFQHSTHIKSAKYNEPKKQLYILDDNKNLILINVDDEKQQITLPHCFDLWNPTFDSTGHHIITGSNRKTITLSNTDGKEITTIIPEYYPEIVTFNHPGNQILIAGQENIQLRNLDGTLITNCNLESEYKIKIAKFFSNSDNLIFLAPYKQRGANHTAKLWDVRDKNLISYNHIPSLKKISLHPEGSYLACIKEDLNPAAYIYDLRKKGSAYLDYKTKSAKFNFRGTHLLTQYYMAHLALLWKTETIIPCIGIEEYPNAIKRFNPTNLSSATFHPHENRILTHSIKNNLSRENNFSIWDFNGKQLAKLPHEKTIYSAKYDPTGNYIISKHDSNIERNIKSDIVTLWQKENS